MKINYAIICYSLIDDDKFMEIKHKCCYENEPSQVDVDSLINELATDEEFSMTDDHEYEIMMLDRSVESDAEIMNAMNIPEEINE